MTDTLVNEAAHWSAMRIMHGKTPKVHIYCDGEEYEVLGGNRAARAAGVILARYPVRDGRPEPKMRVMGLRSDLHKAETEAYSLYRTERRHHGHAYKVTPAEVAFAIPVEEAA